MIHSITMDPRFGAVRLPVQNGVSKPSLISNITNSNDPKDVNARIFVGNLNTLVLSKEEVEGVFKRYGSIVALSLHKGYAFIQYVSEVEARSAVRGEDQRVYAGQQIDVNLVGEPKVSKPKQKRARPTGLDWETYYGMPVLQPSHPLQCPISLAKRPCPGLTSPSLTPALPAPASVPHINNQPFLAVTGNGLISNISSSIPRKVTPRRENVKWIPEKHPKSSANKSGDPDILICGTCKQTFPNISKFVSHKQKPCRLQFICKCDETKTMPDNSKQHTCATCNETFRSSWELCQHCQTGHNLKIYTVSEINEKGSNSSASCEHQVNGSSSISSTVTPASDTCSEMSDGSSVDMMTNKDIESQSAKECSDVQA